ncbi:hypothetical protein ACFZAM_31780 [Streptomyces sp. NPDC008079]|uniref:hypothetical protein n=1 Tax=Streptomyces sp. NPDC008079 TaxID=3364806 RepID=UPI0036EB3CD2
MNESAPTKLHVSRFLGAAGFQRSVTTSNTITAGFKVSSLRARNGIGVHWVESLDEADRRRREAGTAQGPQLAATYVNFRHAYIEEHSAPDRRRTADGMPLDSWDW